MVVRTHWLSLGALLLAAAPALAEDVTGIVRVVGSSINSEVLVGDGGPNLCRNDVAKRMRRLTAMTATVSGDWQTKPNGDKKCFAATGFTVTKVSSGRDAVVGKLEQRSGAYVVTTDDGKAHALASAPDGLKKLVGQKVILDLKGMDSPAAKEATFNVVTYAAFP
jgi:hypothetical protein